MKDYSHPEVRLPYLASSAARCLDQIHDRLKSELEHILCSSDIMATEPEPDLQLGLEEVGLMIGNLSRAAHLLRVVSEGAE